RHIDHAVGPAGRDGRGEGEPLERNDPGAATIHGQKHVVLVVVLLVGVVPGVDEPHLVARRRIAVEIERVVDGSGGGAVGKSDGQQTRIGDRRDRNDPTHAVAGAHAVGDDHLGVVGGGGA